ncbi:MAG: hypothetical protein CVV50_04685 [Spirochaetae bacterium HGW-Spirochaetae-6]|nr:MAG: hypothetical protein CVV50_04685 [Spirochaetae bacterium HGW-Spirochaetae-6]
MAKELAKKMQEIMELFVDFGKQNPLLKEVKDLAEKMKEMTLNFQNNKLDLTANVYESLENIFDQYKSHVKIINKQKDSVKEAMKKLKNFYQDVLSKKIKDFENFKVTQDSFNGIKQSINFYNDTLESLNKHSEIFIEAFKDMKSAVEKPKETQTISASPAPKTTTQQKTTSAPGKKEA